MDRERFRRVMINLIDNASQALKDPAWAPPEGWAPRVTVSTALAGPMVRITVSDNGPGIPADKLPRIFDPLFTTKSFGVGLGLPMVRQIVEQHAGTIEVASVGGAGATFTISLPRLTAAALPRQAAA